MRAGAYGLSSWGTDRILQTQAGVSDPEESVFQGVLGVGMGLGPGGDHGPLGGKGARPTVLVSDRPLEFWGPEGSVTVPRGAALVVGEPGRLQVWEPGADGELQPGAVYALSEPVVFRGPEGETVAVYDPRQGFLRVPGAEPGPATGVPPEAGGWGPVRGRLGFGHRRWATPPGARR